MKCPTWAGLFNEGGGGGETKSDFKGLKKEK